MKPKKKIPLGEQGQFKDKPVTIDGKPHALDVSEKMGKDGVIETHCTYRDLNPPRRCSRPRVAGFGVSQKKWDGIFKK